MKTYRIRLDGKSYDTLRQHLFPGDGNEAVAFALCGRYESDHEDVYLVHQVELYPHDKCTIRSPQRVMWSPPDIVHLLEECRQKGLHLLKIHCHPEHWPWFSEVDTESDLQLSDTLKGWTNRDDKVLSVIMLPDGHLFGRVVTPDGALIPLNSIIVISDEILHFHPFAEDGEQEIFTLNADPEVQLRLQQAFGEGTVRKLQALRIGIVGCSGTGSIVAELLGRLGVGHLVLVDPDLVEPKNLNRILNSRERHADEFRPKVEVLKEAIESFGTGITVTALRRGLHEEEAYNAIAGCDVVFGGMDSIDGRHLLNRITTFFCTGYFDIGIRLDADGKGGVKEVFGRVDYIQPRGSSLLSRERYTSEQLRSADLARTDPDEYAKQLKDKYIVNAKVESPAVISINMVFASQAVNELLARLHPFRDSFNSHFAAVSYSISGFMLLKEEDGEPDKELEGLVGLGAVTPALYSPMLITANKPTYEITEKISKVA